MRKRTKAALVAALVLSVVGTLSHTIVKARSAPRAEEGPAPLGAVSDDLPRPLDYWADRLFDTR